MARYPIRIEERSSSLQTDVVFELDLENGWLVGGAVATSILAMLQELRRDHGPPNSQPQQLIDSIDRLAHILYTFAGKVVESQTYRPDRLPCMAVRVRNRPLVRDMIYALEGTEALYVPESGLPAMYRDQVRMPHWHPNFQEHNEALRDLCVRFPF